MTGIEWTNHTWNVFAGCTKVSPGCKHCYAITDAVRMGTRIEKYDGVAKEVGPHKYNWTGRLNFDPKVLREPYDLRFPSRIFVNSMSDMFHEDAKFEWINKMFDVMNECQRHQFQILTKRGEVLEAIAPHLKWTPNIHMGVSVENEDYVDRIDHLRRTPAYIKWISAEPLLGPMHNLNLEGIHWVVSGGLSGGDAPKMPQFTELTDWVRDIRDQCAAAKVAFFHKQWGGGTKPQKKAAGRLLDGKEYMEYPVPL